MTYVQPDDHQRKLNVFNAEAHRFVFDLGSQYAQAISSYEMYAGATRDDGLRKNLNDNGVRNALDTINANLRYSTVVVLCRLWDNSRKTRSIKGLLDLLKDPRIAETYGPGSRHKTYTLSAVAVLRERAENVRKTVEYRALKNARDERIAHAAAFDPNRRRESDDRVMNTGDELAVIRMTSPILTDAGGMMRCQLRTDRQHHDFWRAEAARFWAHVQNESHTS